VGSNPARGDVGVVRAEDEPSPPAPIASTASAAARGSASRGGSGRDSACLTSVAARIRPTGGASRIRLLENLDLTRFSRSSAASCLHVTPTTAACTCVCCSKSITAYNSVCFGRCAKRSKSSSTNTTLRRPPSSTLSTSRMNATFSANPAARLNSSSSPAAHSCSAISCEQNTPSESNCAYERKIKVETHPHPHALVRVEHAVETHWEYAGTVCLP